jgi:hypothetical protein
MLDPAHAAAAFIVRTPEFVMLSAETGNYSTPSPNYKGTQPYQRNNHWLTFACNRRLRTLRDLTGQHVRLLKEMQTRGTEEICKHTGVDASAVYAYIHYPPSVYQLHIHFVWSAPSQSAYFGKLDTLRVHALHDVIKNLSMNGSYYAYKPMLVPVNRKGEHARILQQSAVCVAELPNSSLPSPELTSSLRLSSPELTSSLRLSSPELMASVSVHAEPPEPLVIPFVEPLELPPPAIKPRKPRKPSDPTSILRPSRTQFQFDEEYDLMRDCLIRSDADSVSRTAEDTYLLRRTRTENRDGAKKSARETEPDGFTAWNIDQFAHTMQTAAFNEASIDDTVFNSIIAGERPTSPTNAAWEDGTEHPAAVVSGPLDDSFTVPGPAEDAPAAVTAACYDAPAPVAISCVDKNDEEIVTAEPVAPSMEEAAKGRRLEGEDALMWAKQFGLLYPENRAPQ